MSCAKYITVTQSSLHLLLTLSPLLSPDHKRGLRWTYCVLGCRSTDAAVTCCVFYAKPHLHLIMGRACLPSEHLCFVWVVCDWHTHIHVLNTADRNIHAIQDSMFFYFLCFKHTLVCLHSKPSWCYHETKPVFSPPLSNKETLEPFCFVFAYQHTKTV